MARKKLERTIDVTGKSFTDLLNINYKELNKLKLGDLKSITSRLVSVANKRIKRFSRSEKRELSTAYQNLVKTGRKKFSVKNKDINELRNELTQVINFLKLETSSQRKTKSSKGLTSKRKSMYKTLGVKAGSWSIEQEKLFWEEYRKLEESLGGSSSVKKNYGSTNLINTYARELNIAFSIGNDTDLYEEVMKTLKELNEKLSINIYESKEVEDDEVTDAFSTYQPKNS